MRTVSALALLAVVAAAASTTVSTVCAQTIEERAAEVRRSMAAPPPVETVIDLGQTQVNRAVAPTPGPAPAPTPSRSPAQGAVQMPGADLAPPAVNTPTAPLVVPAVPSVAAGAFATPPEFLERLNRVFGQTGQKGDAGWGALPGPSTNQGLGFVPSFVRQSPQGAPVRGATNVTTVPRSYQPGDGSP